MSSEQFCVITNVDSLMGYALAYCLLEENRNSGNNGQFKLRLLCRKKQDMDELTRLGADVREVDYSREDQVRECIRNAKAVILIPEHDQQRLHQGENVIKAAKNENVHHLCMISILGVESMEQRANDHQFRTLNQYRQLEEKVKEAMGSREKHTVVRLPIFSQLFYFMAPVLEGQNQLILPIKKEKKWSPVDLQEVVEAISILASKNRQGNEGLFTGDDQRKQVYQFTPRQNLGMDELAKQIGQGLGSSDIKYKQVSREEIEKMFREMRDDKRFKHRPDSHNQAGGRRDKPYTFPLGRYLNDELIETICEVWELVNQGRLDTITHDLKEILGRDPQDVQTFFKNNRDQFRDLR